MDTYILQPARPGRGKGRLGAGQQAKGWLENLQLQDEVVHFQACGIFLWARKQSPYPAAIGSTDVLLFVSKTWRASALISLNSTWAAPQQTPFEPWLGACPGSAGTLESGPSALC